MRVTIRFSPLLLVAFLMTVPLQAQQPAGPGAAAPPGKQARGADRAPRVGQLAPDFRLKSLDGQSETRLSQFRGKKPVVLFFGSYT